MDKKKLKFKLGEGEKVDKETRERIIKLFEAGEKEEIKKEIEKRIFALKDAIWKVADLAEKEGIECGLIIGWGMDTERKEGDSFAVFRGSDRILTSITNMLFNCEEFEDVLVAVLENRARNMYKRGIVPIVKSSKLKH